MSYEYIIAEVKGRVALLALLAFTELCGAQTHPALKDAQLAPLVPARRFVANTDFASGHRLSPDGRKLLWTEVVGFDQGLAVRDLDGTDVRRFATGRLANHAWLADSRHLAYVRDLSGDENTRIFVIDTDDPGSAPAHITPWPKARSLIASTLDPAARKFFFISNRREASAFDLYETDFRGGEVRQTMRNAGDVTQWVIDVDGTLGGRIRVDGADAGANRVFEVRERGAWREIRRWDGHSFTSVTALDRARGIALMLSDIERDTLSAVEVSLADGSERVLASDPRVDLFFTHLVPGSARLYAARFVPDYPLTRVLAPELEAPLRNALQAAFPGGLLGFGVGSADRELRRVLVFPFTAEGSRTMLFDRSSGALTMIRDETTDPEVRALVSEMPVRFSARDGLVINGYLLRPAGTEGRRVPLVALIHGGPWARDSWISKRLVSDGNLAQFLANRGYAVLTVNYRGSYGYGRRFMNAGIGELGNKSQDDIADAVRWAVAEGIADPRKVAILGASFGGFSVYMNLIREPGLYACGVSRVGVANWARAIEEFPPYWKNFMHVFHRFYGDPRDSAQRARLMEMSPVAYLDRIRAPLLVVHGAKYVRVMNQDSEEMVAGLRALGRPVESLTFADEGHSIRRWQNRLLYFRKIEGFLAGCLGGRVEG